MMDYKRGDIVLVNFNPQKQPLEVAKTRPAIIVSDSDLNQVLDLVTVVALTTNIIEESEPLRILIKKRKKLLQDSDAMVEQLRSVAKVRILETLAKLSEVELKKIEYGIKTMLNLS
ncbi:MAG: type II toxin-antitoxin system PemK/MazF family toxin [Sulfurimonas sp.]|nr:type II toxin-antitoxin system PemK/MazF family toxin [Sulfurimonas sp.]